jgi:hypothetical protein
VNNSNNGILNSTKTIAFAAATVSDWRLNDVREGIKMQQEQFYSKSR